MQNAPDRIELIITLQWQTKVKANLKTNEFAILFIKILTPTLLNS